MVIFPPETGNEDHTDEDSGDEEFVDLNNLPGSQLRAPVEIIGPNNSNSETDSDDDVPLSIFCGKSKLTSNSTEAEKEIITAAKSFSWTNNSTVANFSDFDPNGTSEQCFSFEFIQIVF